VATRSASPAPSTICGHDGPVPNTRSIRIRRSQVVWLVAIVVVGVTVGIVAGVWWGVGTAAIMLAISEVIERVQRSRA
jgi:MFS superfamily sulfate permease-like transporter